MNTRLLLLIALNFSYYLTCAQNWMPVVPGEMYHYRTGNSNFINHTIKVDSVKIVGPDKVFFMNRVALRLQDAVIACKGQFFGETVVAYGNGNFAFEYQFYTPLIIIPATEPGGSWVADPIYQINANVTDKAWGTVLGEPDSLKTILFSNGDQWVISKNHGVVSCPGTENGTEAHLSGLETKHLGDRLYRFEDFFDIQVGTEMEYSETSGITPNVVSLDQKVRVLEKYFSQDTAAYRVSRVYVKTTYGTFQTSPTTTYGKDTIMLIFPRAAFPNLSAYNNELRTVFNNQSIGSIASVSSTGVEIGALDALSGFCSIWQFNNGCLMQCAESPYRDWREVFRPGLGQTDTYQLGEPVNGTYYHYYKTLKGAVINGDTVIGAISPDWAFTKNNDLGVVENDFKIYPNPVSDMATIEVKNPNAILGTIEVFSFDGKHMKNGYPVNGSNIVQVNVADFPAGIYNVVIHLDNKVSHVKLVVTR